MTLVQYFSVLEERKWCLQDIYELCYMNKQYHKEPRGGGLKYATKFACRKREKNLITGFFIFLRFFVVATIASSIGSLKRSIKQHKNLNLVLWTMKYKGINS